MVPRYARPDMTAIWSPENRFRIWFEIEAHATDALAELGTVPKSAAKALWDWWATNPRIDVEAIDAIEAVTKHDVIAFLTWVAENVGDEARFMHQGMTSSDVVVFVRRRLPRGTRVGHGGTLDPLASGVLPIALGEATKLAGRMLDARKAYAFTIAFGT